MPIILGLPFLCNNEIHSDYAKCTCVVTSVTPPYDLLATKLLRKHLPAQKTPDVLAAIHERILSLSLEALLAEQENEFRTIFAQVFKPLPHVDELPLEPRACIRLKDSNTTIKSQNYLAHANGRRHGTCYCNNT
jgi:hypothetical protein